MIKAAPTIRFDIFIGGDVANAKQVCRKFCFDLGFCVTVEPVDFIYTGGEESGVRVGIINYPRFPSDGAKLANIALDLAYLLRTALCQHSFSIVGPDETIWFSAREQM